MRCLDDLTLNDVLRQQTDRPTRVTGRWLRARQRGQLRLSFAIENRRNGRCFAFFSRQHCIEPLDHERLARTRYHGQIGVDVDQTSGRIDRVAGDPYPSSGSEVAVLEKLYAQNPQIQA